MTTSNDQAIVTAAGGITIHNSAMYGLVVQAHEHNRVCGDLKRENAKLEAENAKLRSGLVALSLSTDYTAQQLRDAAVGILRSCA